MTFKLVPALALLALSGSPAAAEPFDLQRCELRVATELTSSFSEDSWKLDKNYYPSLAFNQRTGDIEILDKYLTNNGYFAVMMDPADPQFKIIRIYSSSGADARRREMASPQILSKVACEASYVSGAPLKSVWVMSGMEPAFRIEFR